MVSRSSLLPQAHDREPESPRNTPYRHSCVRTGFALSHLKVAGPLHSEGLQQASSISLSPAALQPCRQGRGSGPISLSCADSKVPVEAGRWPARVLNLPGAAETHSGEGRGSRGPGCQPAGVAEARSAPGGVLPHGSPSTDQGVSSLAPTW